MTAPRDPEELGVTPAAAVAEISPQTMVGAVHLTVSDVGRSIGFYESTVGLELLSRGNRSASLGAGGRELLVLVEESGAQPDLGATGLYHFALLVPERADLARWLAHAARDRVALTGLSDHFVSEAIYLSDPDGHGIEIYWDRPREVWDGHVAARMTTIPLDVESLIGELADPRTEPWDLLPADTVMGHIHLKVASVDETVRFYRDALGLALMAQLGPSAAFLAAGGYHHHIGANTWESAEGPPPAPGSAALRLATIVLPDAQELRRVVGRLAEFGYAASESDVGPVVRDPSGNALLFAVYAHDAPDAD
jgi:catechol 2,3-dioxygenase